MHKIISGEGWYFDRFFEWPGHFIHIYVINKSRGTQDGASSAALSMMINRK
jgi:hypothetical protein